MGVETDADLAHIFASGDFGHGDPATFIDDLAADVVPDVDVLFYDPDQDAVAFPNTSLSPSISSNRPGIEYPTHLEPAGFDARTWTVRVRGLVYSVQDTRIQHDTTYLELARIPT